MPFATGFGIISRCGGKPVPMRMPPTVGPVATKGTWGFPPKLSRTGRARSWTRRHRHAPRTKRLDPARRLSHGEYWPGFPYWLFRSAPLYTHSRLRAVRFLRRRFFQPNPRRFGPRQHRNRLKRFVPIASCRPVPTATPFLRESRRQADSAAIGCPGCRLRL